MDKAAFPNRAAFPLSRYIYDSNLPAYYAYGNSPPHDYLQNCIGKKKPSVLLLKSGEILSCFYSLWKNFDPAISWHFEKVNFVLNDTSAAVLARNILFIYLCLQKPEGTEAVKRWLSGMWAIWYCHELYPEHEKMLTEALRTLCRHCNRWACNENPLHPMVKFSSPSTMRKVCEIWKMWLARDILVTHKKMHASRERLYHVNGKAFDSDDSVLKYVAGSIEIPYPCPEFNIIESGSIQKDEVQSFMKTGNAYAESVFDLDLPESSSRAINYTLFERKDGKYSLHFTSMPFSCYFQVVAFSEMAMKEMNPSSKITFLVANDFFELLPFLANSVQQFSFWIQSCHHLFHADRNRIIFEFDCSDALTFCYDLENNKSRHDISTFDLIDTSDLMDHMAASSLILSSVPLLKENGTLFTASKNEKIYQAFEAYLKSSFGFNCKWLPILLGIRCINHENEKYSNPITIYPSLVLFNDNGFSPHEELFLWEKVQPGAIPLCFPPGSKLPSAIATALANCVRMSVYPLFNTTCKVPSLTTLCIESAIKVLQTFVSRTSAGFCPDFWQPLSDMLCATLGPYLLSMQTQFLLHGLHMHLTVNDSTCPACLHVKLPSEFGLFYTTIPAEMDQASNFLVFVHKLECNSAKFLQSEVLKEKDVHVFDCVSPPNCGDFLGLCFYAPLQLARDNYKATLVVSLAQNLITNCNALINVRSQSTTLLSDWHNVPFTSFIFSQTVSVPLKALKLHQFGSVASHNSDGSGSELTVCLSDRTVKALKSNKLQMKRVTSNQLSLSCGKFSCCIKLPFPFDYDSVHIKLMKQEGKLVLKCSRACYHFRDEKPLFFAAPDKDLSFFKFFLFENHLQSIAGQQTMEKELIQRPSMLVIKETLLVFFKQQDEYCFNIIVPEKEIQGFVFVNNHLLNYENRAPFIDLAFCFLEKSLMRALTPAWEKITSSSSIQMEPDEYNVLKDIFHYFARQTVVSCESSVSPRRKLNLLVDTGIYKYFTRAVVPLLLCESDYICSQVLKILPEAFKHWGTVQAEKREMKFLESPQPAPRTERSKSKLSPASQESKCENCSKLFATTMWCSNCKKVRYCSKECQRAHWATHKDDCRKGQSKAEEKPLPAPATEEADITLTTEMLQQAPPVRPHTVLPSFDEDTVPFPIEKYSYDGDLSSFYYAYGRTPAVDYLQHNTIVKHPSVLLLECGDMSCCFYTLWKNFSAVDTPKRFERVNFVMNDLSSAVLARDILFLLMTLQLPEDIEALKRHLCAMWAIWYCHELHTSHQCVLDDCLGMLLQHSSSLHQWESTSNPLHKIVTFSSWNDLSQISEVWRMWAEFRMPVTDMHLERIEFLEQYDYLRRSGFLGSVLSRHWSTLNGETGAEISRKIGRLSRDIVTYIELGSCFAESVLNLSQPRSSTIVNPTLFERAQYSLYFGSLPYHTYFHTVEFSPEKLIACGVDKSFCDTLLVRSKGFEKYPLLANSFQQFAMWVQSSSKSILGDSATFAFNNQRFITFCQKWQNCAGYYRHLFEFDLIFTSNLMDHEGLTSVLLSSLPLLKDNGLLFTKTLLYKNCADTLDEYLRLCFGFDCKLLPVVLGIRCINNEGDNFSSPVLAQPVPSQTCSFQVLEECLRVLIWKKVRAQRFLINKLPDSHSGNITEALADSITSFALALLNKTGREKMAFCNSTIETVTVLIETFELSVLPPFNHYQFYAPLANQLREKIKPFLHCLQTQLLAHGKHMHLTIEENECPLCKDVKKIDNIVGLFEAKLKLPLPHASPFFLAVVHREESSDAQFLCTEARFSSQIHLFDSFVGTYDDKFVTLRFYAPLKFADYKVTVCTTARSPFSNGFKTALAATALKQLQIDFIEYAFWTNPFIYNVNAKNDFGHFASHICNGDKVHSEITLSDSVLENLDLSAMRIIQVKSNMVALVTEPYRFFLRYKFPVGSYHFHVDKALKKVVVDGYREPHQFEDEVPLFFTYPDHHLSLLPCRLEEVVVTMHCAMAFTPTDVRVKEECNNDIVIMPPLICLKDAFMNFFRDHNDHFFLKSLGRSILGVVVIDRRLLDYEHKVPALDMAFCFFEDDYDAVEIVKVCSKGIKCDAVSAVILSNATYQLMRKVVRYLGKKTFGTCKSAGPHSKYSNLCEHNVDRFFTRVVAYPFYCDPDLQGFLAIKERLQACGDIGDGDIGPFTDIPDYLLCSYCENRCFIVVKCTDCKDVQYCSVECRSKHYPFHSVSCIDSVPKIPTATPKKSLPGKRRLSSEFTTVTGPDSKYSKPAIVPTSDNVKGKSKLQSSISVPSKVRKNKSKSRSLAPVATMNLVGSKSTASVDSSTTSGKKGRKCDCCGKLPRALKRCIRCGMRYYCGKECQVQHWPVHKLECNKVSQSDPSAADLSKKESEYVKPQELTGSTSTDWKSPSASAKAEPKSTETGSFSSASTSSLKSSKPRSKKSKTKSNPSAQTKFGLSAEEETTYNIIPHRFCEFEEAESYC